MKKFLTSVADAYAYDADDNIIFVSKALLDSSIEVTLGSAPVRGGRGNKLQYTYYHTAEFNVTLTDTQWNLAMLGPTVGDTQSALHNYYKEETITMSGSSASVSSTPLAFEGTTIYGWATDPNGVTQKIELSEDKTFTVSGSVAGDWCIRYYTKNTTSGNGITIPANMVPKVVKLVMETQLNSADVTTNKIGIVQIVIPRLQLSGAFTISMASDGIANTPLTGTALEFLDTASQGCDVGEGYYAKIVEIIDNTNWFDNLVALAAEGGDFSLAVGDTQALTIFGIPKSGASFRVPNDQLTFTSSASTIATVAPLTGVVTAVSSGSATIEFSVTGHPTISGEVDVTVS